MILLAFEGDKVSCDDDGTGGCGAGGDVDGEPVGVLEFYPEPETLNTLYER